MPIQTYPNQRTVVVHREPAKSDFLGIKNENWTAAARDLGAHALMLYLYLASNKDNYNLALSQVDVFETIGMPKSTYHDQFKKLVLKGYLVQTHGNTYDFYEVPQTRTADEKQNCDLSDGQQKTAREQDCSCAVQESPYHRTEINNTENNTNESINNNIPDSHPLNPEVEEIIIPVPKREGKKKRSPSPYVNPKREEFVF